MNFVKPQQLTQKIGVSLTTLKRYRLTGIWLEGIHWHRLNSRTTLYNLELIEDWINNRSNPSAHQQAIAAYLQSLPSNQPRKRGRRAS